MEDLEVRADAVVLATGRFLSGGLGSDRRGVFEQLIGLPLRQPETRKDWFRTDYLDPQGHALNRAGVPVDAAFRPVDAEGDPVDPRLFAAGAILAGQDWVRSRSGAGIAIASAWGAVQSI
jgi:glycerol-3-phosphate dehydrogenase subunit B